MPFRSHPARLSLVLAALLTACASGPKQVAPDTYALSKRSDSGGFANVEAVKADLARQANEFAQGRDQTVVPISAKETAADVGRPATVEYRFRVVDKAGRAPRAATPPAPGAPAAAPGAAVAAPAAAVPAGSWGAPLPGQAGIPAGDLYSELLKLDDLRKRGILTQAEFDDLKRKLLARQ